MLKERVGHPAEIGIPIDSAISVELMSNTPRYANDFALHRRRGARRGDQQLPERLVLLLPGARLYDNWRCPLMQSAAWDRVNPKHFIQVVQCSAGSVQHFRIESTAVKLEALSNLLYETLHPRRPRSSRSEQVFCQRSHSLQVDVAASMQRQFQWRQTFLVARVHSCTSIQE